MEFFGTLLGGENLRTALILAVMVLFFIRFELKLERRFGALERRIDKFEADVDRRFDAVDRKFDSVKALTFVLNKSSVITDDDKQYVDSYLKEGAAAWK